MKKVFIITVNYNTEKETHDLLASLRKIKKDNLEVSIVIVDNASSKNFELSPEEKYQNTHLIKSGINTGFSGGNNIGIKFALDAGAEIVVLLNSDTIVKENFLIEIVKFLEVGNQVGIVVPKIYFAKGYEYHKTKYKKNELGRVIWYAGGYIDWANAFSIHRGVDEVDKGQYDKIEQTTFATGCCMAIKVEVLKKVGLFDESFFLYMEDADLSERVQRAGFKILYNPLSIIWHKNAGSSGGAGSSLHDYFITRNRMIFGMRYAPIRSKFALIRESLKLLLNGRPMQKKAIVDFYRRKFGKGDYFNDKT